MDEGIATDHKRRGRRHDHNEAEGRQESACPAHPEPAEPDAPPRGVVAHIYLSDEEAGDEVAADHEEYVDADIAAGKDTKAEVIEDDSKHGDRPQAVEPGEPR